MLRPLTISHGARMWCRPGGGVRRAKWPAMARCGICQAIFMTNVTTRSEHYEIVFTYAKLYTDLIAFAEDLT